MISLVWQVSDYVRIEDGLRNLWFSRGNKHCRHHYWINDKFQELVAFWHTVQERESCARLMTELEQLRVRFKSATEIKKYFVRARDQVATNRYDQAFQFFFFNRVTFSGTTRAGGFSAAASLRRFTAGQDEAGLPGFWHRYHPWPYVCRLAARTPKCRETPLAAAGMHIPVRVNGIKPVAMFSSMG